MQRNNVVKAIFIEINKLPKNLVFPNKCETMGWHKDGGTQISRQTVMVSNLLIMESLKLEMQMMMKEQRKVFEIDAKLFSARKSRALTDGKVMIQSQTKCNNLESHVQLAMTGSSMDLAYI
jgi:hypothetical protein